jgi:hypothetical protein
MRNGFLWAGLGLLLALPVTAADKGNKKGDKPQPATQADYDALVQARSAVGTVSDLGGSERTFTLVYRYQYLVPKGKPGKGNSQVQNLLREQQNILRTTDPIKREARLEQFIQKVLRKQANGSLNGFKVVKGRRDFDLRAADKVKVRVMEPPVRYDDKGNVQKYTKEELKKLKGKDKTLPGYESNWDGVLDGQTVKVSVKTPKKKKPAAKDKAKDKEDVEDDGRPQVTMVVILKEPDADAGKPEKKGKKKQ